MPKNTLKTKLINIYLIQANKNVKQTASQKKTNYTIPITVTIHLTVSWLDKSKIQISFKKGCVIELGPWSTDTGTENFI